jgi:opacity protein-like surface antigen
MRKAAWLGVLVFALAIPAMAQDELPKFDLFGGYSYVRVNLQGDIHSNLNGASGAVGFYPSRHLGVVGDFGGYHIGTLTAGSSSPLGSGSLPVSGSLFTYLFGPRFRFGGEGATPFVQALFGGAHSGDITCSTSNTACSAATGGTGHLIKSDNAFAMALGGGIDIKLSTHFSVRGQGEYLMTRFKDITSSTAATASQNNARLSVGIVIH